MSLGRLPPPAVNPLSVEDKHRDVRTPSVNAEYMYNNKAVEEIWAHKFFAPIIRMAKRDGESSEELQRKLVLLPPSLVLFGFFFVFLIYEVVAYETSGPIRIGLSAFILVLLSILVYNAFHRRELPKVLVESVIAGLVVVSLVSDLVNVGLYDHWMVVIILMDALLVTNADPTLSWALFAVSNLWIVLKTAEDSERFGMYDPMPYNDDPPPRPAQGWAWGGPVLIARLGVFGTDYALTRRFSMGMRTEHSKVKKAAAMANDVARALIRFDLDEAEELIGRFEDCPLHKSFCQLVENLRLYRPYLPAALFGDAQDDFVLQGEDVSNAWHTPVLSSQPPGITDEHATLTFGTIHDKERSEIDLSPDSVLVMEDISLRKKELELGLKHRKGSLMRIFYNSQHEHEDFHAIANFAEHVLEVVQRFRGTPLELRSMVVLAAWNTHLPSPHHALDAARCVTSLASEMDGCPFSWQSTLASGSLSVGLFGTNWQRAPFVQGLPLKHVETLSFLCRNINCKILMTEATYDGCRPQIPCRLVDMIDNDPTLDILQNPRSLGANPIGVYEVLTCMHPDLNRYNEAFVSFCTMRNPADSVTLLAEYVKANSSDIQGLRILRLAAAAAVNRSLFPAPYKRPLIGWENWEAQARQVTSSPAAEALGDEVQALLSTEGSTTTGTPCLPLRPSLIPQIDQLHFHTETDSLPPGGSELRREFTDNQATKFIRSDRLLGKGSFGEVWLGMGEEGGLVALKTFNLREKRAATEASDTYPTESILTMSFHKAENPNRAQVKVKDVVKEIEMLSQLHHENIVAYLSCAVVGWHVVICMEYVPGGSLHNLLEQFGTLAVSTVRRYTKDILRGLSYLHEHDIAHRDFKPGNVLVTIEGQCKLADFGASTALSEMVERAVVGTLMYMAPEACRGEATCPSDIWGVGIAVCVMLTGKLPYDVSKGIDPHSFLFRLAKLYPDALPVVPDVKDSDARAFMVDCVQNNPGARPTASALLLHPFLTL